MITLPARGREGTTTERKYVMSNATLTAVERDLLAQVTAEYIATNLTAPSGHVQVFYVGDRRPPRTIPEIKEQLLGGHVWISWMCDQVTEAMRALHGEPTGDAELFASPIG